MSKKIDKDALVKEVERLKGICTAQIKANPGQAFPFVMEMTGYDKLLTFINSLPDEPASEDLEEELYNWRHEHFEGERDGHFSGEYLERSSQLDLARHFYELGKNSK